MFSKDALEKIFRINHIEKDYNHIKHLNKYSVQAGIRSYISYEKYNPLYGCMCTSADNLVIVSAFGKWLYHFSIVIRITFFLFGNLDT
jgi:hypothetical protein